MVDRMSLQEEAESDATRYTKQEFVMRYRHPFLAIRIESDEEAAEFRTIAVGDFAPIDQETPPPSASASATTDVLAAAKKRPGANQFSFVTIGRANNNDVVIPLNSVSKCHAVIHPGDTGYTVADAGSKNGTVVNGTKLVANQPAKLSTGDTITLSHRVTITFLDAEAAYVWLRSKGSR
jgi:hypothetical protein